MAEHVESTSDARADVRKDYRVLTDEEKAQVAAVKDAGDLLLQQVEATGPSREASIARTKIEEAVMWAVKGITA